MTHASGYPDYYPLDFVDRRMRRRSSPDQLLKEYAGGKLDFEPGVAWSYSNTGFVLLGRIIEKVSGKPYEQFLTERILKPLKMNDTVFDPKPAAQGAGDRVHRLRTRRAGAGGARGGRVDSRRRSAVHDAVGPGEMGLGARYREGAQAGVLQTHDDPA